LIWLARIFTSSCVATDRAELVTTAPAELMCFANFAATVLPYRLSRASMMISLLFVWDTPSTPRPGQM
jgi:hypothetical protein